MKLILISGLADIDKPALIDLALQRAGRKNEFRVVDFDRIYGNPSEIAEAEDIGAARQSLSRLYEKAEKAMITRLKEQKGDLVASGCLTFDTAFGYMRAMPDEFFKSFNPDLIFIIEKDEGKDPKTMEHQRMNRYYGAICSSIAGSALKIIKFRENKTVEAVGELSEILKR